MTEAGPHILDLRVYYEDTDAAGIVYYASYLKFAERGRTEMLRSLGFGHREIWQSTGVAFAVRRCSVEYHAPAHLDDALTVETRVDAVAGATLSLNQKVRRDGQILASLDVLVACVGPEGKPRRVPAEVRAALTNRSLPLFARSIVQKTP